MNIEEKPVKPKRRRLKPEDRRQSILDHAATIVASEGVAVLTMDRISKEVGVSKSLIYAYFPNVTELLKELFARELKRLRYLQGVEAEKAQTFENLVRHTTRVYLQYIDERGLLLQRLQSEPSVTDGISGPTYYSRDVAVHYIADIVHLNFDIPLDVARAATDISFGLPEAAGNYLHNSGACRQEIEDLTVTMIIGTFKGITESYMTRLRPLVRPQADLSTE